MGADTKHSDQEASWRGKKVYPTDTSTALFTIEESEDRNSNRAGTDAETVPEHEREDGVAEVLTGLLPYRIQDCQPEDGTIPNELAQPS